MGATAPATSTAAPAPARVGTEPFTAGTPYAGDFPDPSVLRVGSTYVVASTTTAYLNLPVMTSTDLSTWVPRPVRPDAVEWSDDPAYNDAMAQPPFWAEPRTSGDRRALVSQWAPSLARIGKRYVAAYSAAVRIEPRSSCIGIATAADALGPYRTVSPRPLVCSSSRYGAIDPDLLVDRGTPYLLWKDEGSPQRILARRLDATGTRFARGSRQRELLRPGRGWEGTVVENPSMVRYRGRYLLFYSGNRWPTAAYATGYAVCESPLGPCRRPKHGGPLLASSTDQVGTGGADAFVDARGRLRLVHHAYDPGLVGEGQPRRLHVARLGVASSGRLWVVSRG